MPTLPILVPKTSGQDIRLIDAAKNGYPSKLKQLLDEGVSIDDTDHGGHSALIFSAMAGHLECVQILLHAGADPMTKTYDGWDAYHAAMFYGDFRGATRPPYGEIMAIIREHGYEPDT